MLSHRAGLGLCRGRAGVRTGGLAHFGALVAPFNPLPGAVGSHLANFGPLSAFFESILKVFRGVSEHLNRRSEPVRTLASRQQLAPRADTLKSQYSIGGRFQMA